MLAVTIKLKILAIVVSFPCYRVMHLRG
jgi:hypothetical protein